MKLLQSAIFFGTLYFSGSVVSVKAGDAVVERIAKPDTCGTGVEALVEFADVPADALVVDAFTAGIFVFCGLIVNSCLGLVLPLIELQRPIFYTLEEQAITWNLNGVGASLDFRPVAGVSADQDEAGIA